MRLVCLDFRHLLHDIGPAGALRCIIEPAIGIAPTDVRKRVGLARLRQNPRNALNPANQSEEHRQQDGKQQRRHYLHYSTVGNQDQDDSGGSI